jgi:hypothetical protein
VFLFGSTLLITITISQLLVLFGATTPDAVPAHEYAGLEESSVFLAALLLLYSLTLAVSFALLKRLSWARPALIGLLGVGIVLNALKLGFGVFISEPHPPPNEGPAPLLWIVRAATVLDVLLPLALIAVFAWLIAKLSNARVRAEFGENTSL